MHEHGDTASPECRSLQSVTGARKILTVRGRLRSEKSTWNCWMFVACGIRKCEWKRNWKDQKDQPPILLIRSISNKMIGMVSASVHVLHSGLTSAPQLKWKQANTCGSTSSGRLCASQIDSVLVLTKDFPQKQGQSQDFYPKFNNYFLRQPRGEASLFFCTPIARIKLGKQATHHTNHLEVNPKHQTQILKANQSFYKFYSGTSPKSSSSAFRWCRSAKQRDMDNLNEITGIVKLAVKKCTHCKKCYNYIGHV